jgi:hypothetical protein
MATYIKSRRLPFVIDLGDMSVREAAELVRSWCDEPPRAFHFGDVGAIVVTFRQLNPVFVSTNAPDDGPESRPVVQLAEVESGALRGWPAGVEPA